MSENSLLQDFITETGEHLEETERNLLRLEQQPDDVETLNTIFRSVHTIKGSSEYLGLEGIAELSHKLEGLLELLRRGERRADSSVIDLLMSCSDRIGTLVDELDRHQEERSTVEDLVIHLKEAVEQDKDHGEDIDAGDIGDDEYDEELFGIFIEQLKEGVSGLEQDVRKLCGPEAGVAVLEKSSERLATLRLSSNYMGYDELKAVYEKWSQALDHVIESFNAGEEVDLEAFARKTMDANIKQVKTLFPKVSFDSFEKEDEQQTDDVAEEADEGADQGLLADFITETGEHLEETERNLLRLEQQPDDVETLNTIFRSVHTIKGSSEYLGLEGIAELSHKLEGLLELLRRGERRANSSVIDLLMNCSDRIGTLVGELDQHHEERSTVEDLVMRLKEAAEQDQDHGEDIDAGDIGDDENDEELFGIFIEQLKEGVSGLEQDVRKLCGPEAGVAVLEKSSDRLATLRLSSNYMGYDDLKAVYEKWSQAVDHIIESFNAGEEVDLEAFARETMDANIKRVKELFPKVSFDSFEKDDEQQTDDMAEEADEGVDQGLLADFIAETGEHLEETERNLLQLEQHPDDIELLNEIFRSMHTIKGSSEYLGMARIAELAHMLETLLDRIRRGDNTIDGTVIDLLMNCNDRIGKLVGEIDADRKEQSSIDDLLSRLESLLNGSNAASESSGTVEKLIIEDDTGAVYAEEYDKELFAIFLEQFNSGLQTLSDETAPANNDESFASLGDQCIERLKMLRSSANYMEYDELTNHYDNWLKRLNDILESHNAGDAVDIEEFKKDIMADNIQKAKNFFYTFRSVSNADEEITEDDVEEAAEIAEKDVEEAAEIAGAPSDSNIETDDDFKSLALDDLRDVDNIVKPEPLPSSDGDEMLLKKLADAFESRLGFSDIVVKQYFNESIENSLFSQDIPDTSSKDYAFVRDADKRESDLEIVDVQNVESMLFSGTGAGTDRKATKLPATFTAQRLREKQRTLSPEIEKDLSGSRRKLGRRQADKFRDRMTKQSIRVDAAKIDALMNQVGELVVSRSSFNELLFQLKDLQFMLKQSQKLDSEEMRAFKAIANRINEATTSFGRITSELQENVMKVRMLPIAQLFSRYPRVVHDLVRGTEKKVNLEIYGEETELDKKVIEQITDPLIHIIRNAVDHGIEDVAERRRKGKDETGTIRMEAYPESNYVVIEISDDGRGIDTAQIKRRAIEKEFITADEAAEMTDEELLSFIMRPGFSTTDEVTLTSGRGVGMDVVKDNIEKLNGTIEITSSVGTGARFQIKIPLTLAIFPALLVRVVDEIFTIPLSTVDETIRVHKNEISTIEGVEVYDLRGNTVPLIRLEEVLNMRGGHTDKTEQFVVIINTGAKQVGFVVDELKGRQEVVIKPLEDYLQEKSGFSGATILGDGNISLIIDVFDMVQISFDKHTSKVKETIL